MCHCLLSIEIDQMKYTLALVEYLNTFPFSIGLEEEVHTDQIDVRRVVPSACARLFASGEAAISLCPIGALPDLRDFEIRSNFCIGADGAVSTVMLFSRVPLEEITAVKLDSDSRTSILLVQILAERLWKVSWDFYTDDPNPTPESCLMIGDKVFIHQDQYPYHYDLATAWKTLTGLPMVFAVWIARPEVPEELTDVIDRAFYTGIQQVREDKVSLENWKKDYLLNRISYPLDDQKRKALQLYLDWAAALTPKATPQFT
jgi:chorismate dehydratase